MPRESSKCREWEKERRIRLNEGFITLCKLLPCYDPSINTSKIDVLRHASTYIEELQNKVKDLMSSNNDESTKKAKGEELKKLQERIKRLLNKNEVLCGLLREAKITIPPSCSIVKKFKVPLNWSSKILPEQAKILQKKEQEKENVSVKKSQARKFSSKHKNKVTVQNGTPKHRKAILNRSDSKKLRSGQKKKVIKSLTPSKCVIVLSQPSISQSCYVITNAPSNNILGNTSTIITNSGLVTNPLVSSNSKATKTISSIPPLGPGTLILANGTIMPVLPQQAVLPLASQIITNPLPLHTRPANPTVILLPRNSVSVQNGKVLSKAVSSGVKTLTKIKPKYCLTRTTQVNKVPIPALTSRYANNDLVLSKNETKSSKIKVIEKKALPKEVEKKAETAEKRKLPCDNNDDAKRAKNDDNSEDKNKDSTVEKETNKIQEDSDNKAGTVVEDKAEKVTESVEKCQDKSVPQVDPVVETSKESTVVNPIENAEETEKTADPEIKKSEEALELNINHSELSNDIFASLQVPAGCQNPESTSPTAAFLLAFPLVSSLTGVKVTEVTEEDNTESQRGTPTLLQIGTMDTAKPTQSESLTPSLLNLDNLSFFSTKDISGFYNSFESSITTTTTVTTTPVTKTTTKSEVLAEVVPPKSVPKVDYQQKPNLTACFENRDVLPNPVMVPNSNNNNNNNNALNHQLNYQMKPKQSVGKNIETKQACANYVPQKPFNAQCNNFNDSPKVSTTCSFANVIKSYPDPLYTNSNTYSYSYPSETNFNQNYYKNITKTDNRSYYSLNYENYSDYRKSDGNFSTTNYYNNSNYSKDKFSNNAKSKNVSHSRPPINWMTTPDNRLQTPATEYALPQFTKESDFGHNTIYPTNTFSNTQTSYFNTNPVYPNNNDVANTQEPRKTLDLPLVPPVNTYQRNEVEENQFSWSPTKMPQFLEPSHSFVSSTLPTLVGDLALGNPLTFAEQKTENKCQKKETNARRLKNYENNQSNFLSVSQLVDHNKNEPVPARTTTRRNSGNRSAAKKVPQQKSSQRSKTQDVKEVSYPPNKVEGNSGKSAQIKQQIGGYSNNVQGSNDIFCDASKNNRNISKNTSSNYTAEALIGHQMQTPDLNQKNRQQNYASGNKPIPVPSFLHDNIIPYFPTVDLQQDNNYMQQNQNYQGTSFSHNFPSTFQNNTYTPNTFIPTATTITSTYLGTNNFMHDMGAPTHDYTDNLNLFTTTAPNKDKSCNKNLNRSNVRDQQNVCAVSGNPKKSKRKHSNETNLPGFVDFPFLSMPASINSPILPDDFHTHTGFLQPPTPQLYPGKNPLYTKQNDLSSGSLLPLPPVPVTRSNIQHPEISPSINAGTSLTNFNLSTIFPEINNKSALPDPFLEPRIKENSSRSYGSTVQVSFNDKPNFSFSYINSSSSQPYKTANEFQ